MTESLFGDGGRPIKNKEKPKTDGVVTRLEEVYRQCFADNYGADVKPYSTSPARDRKHLKQLAGTLGEETVASLIRRFFKTKDPRITRTDYSVWSFCVNAQYLQVSGRRAGGDGRTASNLDAARRAVEGGKR